MNIVNGVRSGVNGVVDKVYSLIATAPTTNIRILMTLGIVLGTAIHYWTSTWIPVWEWLIFLAGMAGLDVWQHHNKRKTSWSPTEQAEADRIRNGHSKPIPTLEEDVAGEEEMG
jgi:protein-S-isoprenylcysteine O-methyltransferase Ste14